MPCHVVRDVRCQADQCSSQVCHLSQSVSGGIWQPLTLPVRGGGGSTKLLKRETVKRGEGENQTKVAGTDSVTAWVTKIKLISREERLWWVQSTESSWFHLSSVLHLSLWNWEEGVTTNTLNITTGANATWFLTSCRLNPTVTRRNHRSVNPGALMWDSNIGQISTSKEHVTPWLTYSTSIIFLFSCPVIWNLSWQSEVLFSLSQFSR